MRKLRNRQRVDRLVSEKRARRGSVLKWVYLGLLALLVLWILNLFFGDLFVFRAEGLVVRERATASVTYTGRVTQLDVQEGDRVSKGDVVARMESVEILNDVATFRSRLSDLRVHEAELVRRERIAGETLSVAQKRVSVFRELRQAQANLYERGLGTKVELARRRADEFSAAVEAARIRAEKAAVAKELEEVDTAISNSKNALSDLKAIYDEGRVRAPVDGVVTDTLAQLGSVQRKGDPVVKLGYGETYVIAYASAGSVAPVSRGEAVQISFGVKTYEGRIAQILPLSDRLPAEFQRAFQPTQRNQILRVNLATENPEIPLFTKVIVTRPSVIDDVKAFFQEAGVPLD